MSADMPLDIDPQRLTDAIYTPQPGDCPDVEGRDLHHMLPPGLPEPHKIHRLDHIMAHHDPAILDGASRRADTDTCSDCGEETTPAPFSGTPLCGCDEPTGRSLRDAAWAEATEPERRGVFIVTPEPPTPLEALVEGRIRALRAISRIVRESMNRADQDAFLALAGKPFESAELRLRWNKAMSDAGLAGPRFHDQPEAAAQEVLDLRVSLQQSQAALVRQTARSLSLERDLQTANEYLTELETRLSSVRRAIG